MVSQVSLRTVSPTAAREVPRSSVKQIMSVKQMMAALGIDVPTTAPRRMTRRSSSLSGVLELGSAPIQNPQGQAINSLRSALRRMVMQRVVDGRKFGDWVIKMDDKHGAPFTYMNKETGERFSDCPYLTPAALEFFEGCRIKYAVRRAEFLMKGALERELDPIQDQGSSMGDGEVRSDSGSVQEAMEDGEEVDTCGVGSSENMTTDQNRNRWLHKRFKEGAFGSMADYHQLREADAHCHATAGVSGGASNADDAMEDAEEFDAGTGGVADDADFGVEAPACTSFARRGSHVAGALAESVSSGTVSSQAHSSSGFLPSTSCASDLVSNDKGETSEDSAVSSALSEQCEVWADPHDTIKIMVNQRAKFIVVPICLDEDDEENVQRTLRSRVRRRTQKCSVDGAARSSRSSSTCSSSRCSRTAVGRCHRPASLHRRCSARTTGS